MASDPPIASECDTPAPDAAGYRTSYDIPVFRQLSTSDRRPPALPSRVGDPTLSHRIEERANSRQALVAARIVDTTRRERESASAGAASSVGVPQEDLAARRIERSEVHFGELVDPPRLLVHAAGLVQGARNGVP